jgi:phage terminase small subunit
MTDQNAPLSPRHERFVLEFLKDGNATRAYIGAGYSPRGAQPSASRLLRRPEIEAAIAAGRQRIAAALELSVERIGREYAQIAFANIDDYVSIEDDGRLRIDLEKASQAQRAGIVELKVSNHSKPEQQVTLRLGKLQALAALTRHVGLFIKKPEPAVPAVDRERYEYAIGTLGEELWEAKERLSEAEDDRVEAMAMLADAMAKLAAAGLAPSPVDSKADQGLAGATPDATADEAPRSPPSAPRAPSASGPSAAPDLRGETENHSNPCEMAAPEEPSPPIELKKPGPSDPPRAPPEPEPIVAGAGNGRIFWNTSRPPQSGPTRHDILRDGAGFPGR